MLSHQGQQYNFGEKPSVTLYTVINHVGTPKQKEHYQVSVLPDNAYLSLGKRLHFRGPTLPVIAVATSEVGPAVLLFVEEVCQVLRFQTNSVPRYQ